MQDKPFVKGLLWTWKMGQKKWENLLSAAWNRNKWRSSVRNGEGPARFDFFFDRNWGREFVRAWERKSNKRNSLMAAHSAVLIKTGSLIGSHSFRAARYLLWIRLVSDWKSEKKATTIFGQTKKKRKEKWSTRDLFGSYCLPFFHIMIISTWKYHYEFHICSFGSMSPPSFKYQIISMFFIRTYYHYLYYFFVLIILIWIAFWSNKN